MSMLLLLSLLLFEAVLWPPAHNVAIESSSSEGKSDLDKPDEKEATELVVKIIAENTPSSSSLIPPKYAAASSFSLTCVVLGVNGEELQEGISYEWTSTCAGSECMVRGQETLKTISARYLSAADAGAYTCEASDLAGCTGSSDTTVEVTGTGMFAEDEDAMLSNNDLTTGDMLHCVTGSTQSSPGLLIGPHGEEIKEDTTDTSDGLSISHSTGALHVNLENMTESEMGVYTCRIPDENGKEVDMNVGIYSPETATVPVVSSIEAQPVSSSTYRLSCLTHGSPPTQIIWEKDGVQIDIASSSGYYSLEQRVVNRLTSAYNSTLTIMASTEDMIGEYTCTVSNRLGTSNRFTKDIRALEVSGHESPVLVGLSRNINCSTHLAVTRMEWLLVGVGNREPVAESEDGSQELVLTLSPETTGLDGTMFMCRVTSKSGNTFEQTITVTVRALQNIVSILGHPNPLVAGGHYTLTCHVHSDLPPSSVTWTDRNRDEVTASNGDIFVGQSETEDNGANGFTTTLTLTLSSLKTAHGGRYACISVVDMPFSRQEGTRDLIVQIPPPTVSILRNPSTDIIYTSSPLEMVCLITIHPSAEETPTEVIGEWTDPSGSELVSNSNLQVYSESQGSEFRLVADFSSLTLHSSQSGSYVCSAHVQPNTSHPYVVSSKMVNVSTSFSINIKVTIEITYDSPGTYPVYSPPNYRTASGVSLRCVASGYSGYLSYRWSSTCSSCFASYSSYHTISDNFLTSRDAGMHTCRVTDSRGNSGSNSTTMNIVGVGIYISSAQSSHVRPYSGVQGVQPSNSFATVRSSRYTSTRMDLYCCSNTTASYTGSFTVPTGETLTSNFWSGYGQITQQSAYSTYAGCIRLRYYRYYYYYSYSSFTLSPNYDGIYTCTMPDSNGNYIQEHIGLYDNYFSTPPSIHQIYSTTAGNSVVLVCKTRDSPPTIINWYRNGHLLEIDGISTNMSVSVTDRPSSSYDITLTVCDSTTNSIMGGSYICEVSNRLGTANETYIIEHEGLSIQCDSEFVVGETVACSCLSGIGSPIIRPWFTTGSGSDNAIIGSGSGFGSGSGIGSDIGSGIGSDIGSEGNSSYSIPVTTDSHGDVYVCSLTTPCGTQEETFAINAIVPDQWATVSVHNSTGENALNNTDYTLTCTVTPMEGMNLPVTVEWVGPDRGVVTSKRNVMVGEVEVQGTVSTLSLSFSPILSSDGGSYTCRSAISVPWMDNQLLQRSATVHMPVTSQTMFQLQLYPLPLCVDWDFDKARDLERDLKRHVERAVRERCDCAFSSSAIYSGEFSCQFTSCKSECDNAAHVTYRAILNGTSNLLTAPQLMQHLQDWRGTGGTLLYNNLFRLRLSSDSECNVSIESFEDEEC